jgi:multicomponent K+:H+ antiporter subunit D
MMSHLPLLPILLPLFAAGLALLAEHRRFGMAPQRAIAGLSLLAQLVVAGLLVRSVSGGDILVYLLGDWPARLGISLMVDRLAALMVLVALLLAIACWLHACAGWDRRAPHFQAFFQIQLMGLNGAFLTGDLFNLFVFFEVLLIASYGLLLSGGRGGRMRAGFHYVSVNIAASTLFLMALGLLYGLLGTLNMAEMAARIAVAPAQDRALIQAAASLLLLVFCTKAALLPLSLWLPETYAHAPGSVAALFAVMTKVGLYAVLRVLSLLFGSAAGALAGFAGTALLVAGVATLALASLGVIAATRLRVLASYLVLASAATLFIAFALGQPATISAGLYYLVHSTFAGAALFLIAHHVRRHRHGDTTVAGLSARGWIVAGLMFLLAAVSLAGLPPLSGFLGKLALLDATRGQPEIWLALLLSSFIILLGLARAGTRVFWKQAPSASEVARRRSEVPGRRLEVAATVLLLGYGVAIAVAAAPVFAYTQAAATQLAAPAQYLEHVRAQSPTLRAP